MDQSKTQSLPTIWDDFPRVKADLQEVLVAINESWQIGFTDIDHAIRSQLNAGKLVRPALTIIFSRLAKGNDAESHDSMIKLAASVELLHLATLIHDDVIDESKLRRGTSSIQAAFGKDTAVYAGDYLLTGMFSLITQADRPKLSSDVITALQAILYGELAQKQERYVIDDDFNGYLKRIKGKTGALFQLAAKFGIASGHEAVDEGLATTVDRFAGILGVTFQLLDDYLDFESISQEVQLGKPVGQDIRNGIYTAPVMFALEQPGYSPQIRSYLEKRDEISNDDMQKLHALIIEAGGMQSLSDLLADYQQQLNDLLNQLPSKELQDDLQQLAKLLMNRQN
ncbi:polyprenyl synthetase family protein [Eupransor demetentiae]|uniref:Geranylgeranyl pyrophosphate synthase (IspA) n=1 Tax=Eupransor demetentiae TaxID=3109584 RepID=A0ABP0EUB5_9LACO|nr:Geranylgeranyl pyrophosphate synthase (IspA) [Lactobacillaceae bacterium LMG 33000]